MEKPWTAENSQLSEAQQYSMNTLKSLEDKTMLWIQDKHIKEICKKEFVHFEARILTDPISHNQWLDDLKESIANLTYLQSLQGITSWFDFFTMQISELKSHERNGLLETIVKESPVKLTCYFTQNGYPSTPLEMNLLFRELDYKFEVYGNINQIEFKLQNVKHANIESLLNIYAKIELPSTPSEVFILLKKLSEWNNAVYETLTALLSNNTNELVKLLNAVTATDSKNDTHHYESLKYTLLSISPSFEFFIEAYEESQPTRTDSLYHSYINALSWPEAKLNWALYQSKNEYGDLISINLTQRPPLRELTLEGSNYSLEAKHEIGELHQPNLDYQIEREGVATQLNTINTLKSSVLQNHIVDLVEHEYSFAEIQRILRLVYNLDTHFITSLEQLTTDFYLQNQTIELEEKLNRLNAEQTDLWHEIVAIYREKIFEKDEKTREVLTFIGNIGFDLIPKENTDQILKEIQSWMIIVEGLNLDPARLDLSQWMFGESPTEAWTNKWKKNLVIFFNKMISGNVKEPLDVAAHIGLSGKTEDKTDMRHQLASYWVISSGGIFQVEKVREKFKKKS